MLLSVCTMPKTTGTGSALLRGSSGVAPGRAALAIASYAGEAGRVAATAGRPGKSRLVHAPLARRGEGPRQHVLGEDAAREHALAPSRSVVP